MAIQEVTRLQQLYAVLRYDTLKKLNCFTDVERICINQERGFIMAVNSALENDEPSYLEGYGDQPKHIKSKISFISNKIEIDPLITLFELLNPENN